MEVFCSVMIDHVCFCLIMIEAVSEEDRCLSMDLASWAWRYRGGTLNFRTSLSWDGEDFLSILAAAYFHHPSALPSGLRSRSQFPHLRGVDTSCRSVIFLEGVMAPTYKAKNTRAVGTHKIR